MNQANGDRPAGALADDSPVDALDEQLVAYLDGELEPEERKQLEIQLGRSAELRLRLRTLQDGWEMLDDLPVATPSAVLLESTLRMAATEATLSGKRQSAVGRGRFAPVKRLLSTKLAWLLLLSLLGFASGALAIRLYDDLRFQNQLRQLPIAMHVDAYLHGADLELMRSLMQMPQWQQAVAIAEQLGEWDLTLQQTISEATPRERQEILPELPIEDQQEVTEAWQRFEQLADQEKQTVLQVASRVSAQSDAEQLLATMQRYALWRQTLPPPQRVLIASADPQQRQAAISDAIQQTTRQWTQQTARKLSDEDFETIYQALRQIARLRIGSLELQGTSLAQLTLKTFGTEQQAMDPRMEALFLRQLFKPREAAPPRPEHKPSMPPGPSAPPGPPQEKTDPSKANPPPPPRVDFTTPSFRDLLPLLEQISGPLDGDELWMIESLLSRELAEFLAVASNVEMLREELLRSWADDAIRRMSYRRSGTTLSERYELIDPSRRDQLDLLPPDKILDELRDEGRRRRFSH